MSRCRSILPPYLLEALARNGSEPLRSVAVRSLVVDGSFRTTRTAPSTTRAAAPSLAGGRARTVFDARGSTELPGTQVRAEGDAATGDAAVDEAYDGLGATYDFYLDVLGRDSIDGAGMPLLATVHYDREYDNAFWDGSRMIFGDGDGELFRRFTIAVDVIGHELTHGVTASERDLVYQGQSGALNESVSDVFGSLVKQFAASQSAQDADWLIGVGLFTDRVQGVALRSMAAPGTAFDDPVLGKDPQPADMAGFVTTADDNGGVHLNSGIPNRAFHLAATALGGFAWERAGQVWYATIQDPELPATATFSQFAARTLVHAQEQGDDVRAAVADAWAQVGVDGDA